MRDGYGITTYSSGNKYEGSWYKDKKHGIGEFRKADGRIEKGSFAYGNRNGMVL
jgi:hypothetical protein